MVSAVRDRVADADLNPFDDPTTTQHKVGFIKTAKLVFKRFGRHNVTVIAAGIAFYGLLAMLPTLIALMSIYGLVSSPEEIKDQIAELTENLDGDSKTLVETITNEAADKATGSGGVVGTIVGIGLALFSSSGAVQKLMHTVNAAYEARETRPGLFLRGLAYLFTFLGILFVVAVTAVLGVIPALAAAADLGSLAETTVNVAIYPFLAVMFIGALTVLYRYSPDRDHRTPWRNKGAVVATGLWVLSAVVFSYYARSIGSFGAAYALLGGIAGLIIFLQLTSISIIVGAEVNAVLEDPANASTPVGSARPRAASTGPVTRPVDRLNAATIRGPRAVPVPAEPISFGKALLGLLALFFLGRDY